MLCYYFPPLRSSGTTRSLEFANRLPEHGWKPTVLTVEKTRERWTPVDAPVPKGVEIHRSYEVDLHGATDLLNGAASKLFSLLGQEWKKNYFRELLCVPDSQIAWCTTLPGKRLAEQVDCIYASCSPFSSSLSGYWLKKLSGKPLVLDFRDAWSLNPHIDHIWLHRVLVNQMEKMCINAADALIVNTEGAARLYREAYPQHAEKIVAIPNGYDQLDCVAVEDKQTEKYVIMHVGTFYGERKPDLLLEALAELNDPEIEFVQVGQPHPSFEQYASKVSITVTGSVQREEALRRLKQASLLYLKQGHEQGVSEYIAVAAKTYEYLATGLPILADCPPGDNIDIVEKFAAQQYCISNNDVEALKQAVLQAKQAWAETLPSITPEFVDSFSRETLTGRLAEVLNKVSANR